MKPEHCAKLEKPSEGIARPSIPSINKLQFLSMSLPLGPASAEEEKEHTMAIQKIIIILVILFSIFFCIRLMSNIISRKSTSSNERRFRGRS